jgi:transcriptional regulator with XRE-family HTH domain
MLHDMPRDFLAEIVNERTAKNPKFPNLAAEAEERRRFARRLAKLREDKALSQTVVAARMGTSASVVSKLEAGGDVKMSTIQGACAPAAALESRPPRSYCAHLFKRGLEPRELLIRDDSLNLRPRLRRKTSSRSLRNTARRAIRSKRYPSICESHAIAPAPPQP